MFKQVLILGISGFLAIAAWGPLGPANASSQLESRLSSLEVDVNGIELRLNQIQAQLGQFRRSSPSVAPPLSAIQTRRNPQLNRDPMFDRLATLVIELKEQITELRTRVSKLESRGTPSIRR